MKFIQDIKNPSAVFLTAVAAVVVGIAIGYPLGNRVVTKTKTTTTAKVVTQKIAIGLTEQQMIGILNLKPPNVVAAGSKKVGSKTFQCVAYYDKLDAKGSPTTWILTFCGAP